MKKITPLIILLFTQIIISQTLTHSVSQTITDLNSVACEQQFDIVSDNTFYRSFKLTDFGITGSYDISSVQYGIEVMSGAPAAGYPITVSIYTTSDDFPDDDLILVNQVTEMITNQSLQLHSTPITASIPAGAEIVIAIYVKSDVVADGGNGQVTFQIGSNSDGETAESYISAPQCGFDDPTGFEDLGRPDIHLVMNVDGTSATAGIENLALVDFSYYPNPVKERLIMNASENISNVSIFNILGQEIKAIKPSSLKAELDLTTFPSGTYLVKAMVADKMGTFKVVKN